MKKISLILSIVVMTTLILSSCGGEDSKKIGDQVWMTENLNVDKFQNGDPIPHAKTDIEWEKAGKNKQPAWCYYDNDPDNGEKYGKLYNWYAVNDSRGLAPEGWKIPSDKDWSRLTDFLGGESEAGSKMKVTKGDGYDINESGFLGLPGGNRDISGNFDVIRYFGGWWSSTELIIKHQAWYRYLYYDYDGVTRSFQDKGNGLSVRCLRN